MKDLNKIVIFNLIVISCLTAFMSVKANTDSTQLSLAISGGSLSLIAPENATFAGKNFSFDGQQTGDNPLGNISVADSRGTKVGWDINITASDWEDGTKTMAHNGDGSSTGQLSLTIPDISEVSTVSGDSDLTSFQMGSNASFDTSSNTTINLVTVPTDSGSGQYEFSGLSASQFIPGNQEPGNYTTNLTLTIS